MAKNKFDREGVCLGCSEQPDCTRHPSWRTCVRYKQDGEQPIDYGNSTFIASSMAQMAFLRTSNLVDLGTAESGR